MVSSPNTDGIYAVAIVLTVTSIIAIGLRFAARKALARRTNSSAWRSDDWLLLVTMLFQWGLAIILIYGASEGTIGTHTRTDPQTGRVIVTPHENRIAMFSGISQILSVLALGTLKAGVVLFYRRIFISSYFKKASLAILVLIAAWTIAFFFATVLECKGRNLDLLWKSIRTFLTVCYQYKDIQLAHCVTDVATDLVVLALPIREIWKLHMKVERKIAVSLIFLVGLLSTAAGTARLAVVISDVYLTTGGARDVRGVSTNVLVWTYVEIGVGTVAACLPTVGPLAKSRGVESVIASVRSMVSLHSSGSSNSRNASGGGLDAKLGKKDLEFSPYTGPDGNHHNRIQVGRGDSDQKLPSQQKIRRDDSVTVSSETME